MTEVKPRGMREKGFSHIIAAFGYSMAGLRVLLREEAARLELVAFVIFSAAFAMLGASITQFIILLALLIFVLCVEALNTAIELIVDRVSPEISPFGKDTKDIGSFAVFCALVLFGGYGGWVVLSHSLW